MALTEIYLYRWENKVDSSLEAVLLSQGTHSGLLRFFFFFFPSYSILYNVITEIV